MLFWNSVHTSSNTSRGRRGISFDASPEPSLRENSPRADGARGADEIAALHRAVAERCRLGVRVSAINGEYVRLGTMCPLWSKEVIIGECCEEPVPEGQPRFGTGDRALAAPATPPPSGWGSGIGELYDTISYLR